MALEARDLSLLDELLEDLELEGLLDLLFDFELDCFEVEGFSSSEK